MATEEPSDIELAAEVAAVVRRPRREPADSFVLHAPLELVARTALLPHVRPAGRPAARQRLREVATSFEAFGPAIPEPPPIPGAGAASLATRLAEAVAAGDLDGVDATASALARTTTPGELRRLLVDEVTPRLSAAAHGPILLFQLSRVAPRGELPGELLRPLARELARDPELRLTWADDLRSGPLQPAEALFDALADTPQLGLAGPAFIAPIMAQAERNGLAATLLSGPVGGVDLVSGARAVLRAAALSMLQEPPDHAPYGWSHCLTLPQAVLGIADHSRHPRQLLAIAATYVLGFRAALAVNPLTGSYRPAPPGLDWRLALDSGPAVAAAAVWHAPDGSAGAITTELATRASAHHDAHLVKYTLACLDAASWDCEAQRLYLSAAASLHGFWSQVDQAAEAPAVPSGR